MQKDQAESGEEQQPKQSRAWDEPAAGLGGSSQVGRDSGSQEEEEEEQAGGATWWGICSASACAVTQLTAAAAAQRSETSRDVSITAAEEVEAPTGINPRVERHTCVRRLQNI